MNAQAFLVILLLQICVQMLQTAKASKDRFHTNITQSTGTTELKKDIQRLENEFTTTYDKYMTLHANTFHNITKQELRKDLEAVDKRSFELETRFKRSGACAKICVHRCIPACNLACCVTRPKGMNRHLINKMEVEAAKKAVTGSRKSIVGTRERYLSKSDMERGIICEPKCLVHCEPSCKFKCCIRVPTRG